MRSGDSASGLIGRADEVAALARVLRSVHDGASASLVLRGDSGVGKSALLQHLIESAAPCEVLRAIGVEGEIDLPYSGLQQLCRPMMNSIDALPAPQRDALGVAFGLATGATPDRYLVGLAVLTLMSERAVERPLLCIVDDAHWLDELSVGALAFVARRLDADSVGLVFATRTLIDDLGGIPEWRLGGLDEHSSRLLLERVLVGRFDPSVRERLLAETDGNPLAIIELPRSMTASDAAAGLFGPAGTSLSDRIQLEYTKRLTALPDETRQLLLVAALELVGDPSLVRRAAGRLGCDAEAAYPAEDAGLLTIGERWSFRHPLVRSAVYHSATDGDRRRAHAALADEIDPTVEPARRAWHRAQAATAPDELIAAELEASAANAKARGGLAAAGAFLERAAALTPDPELRAERTMAAAEATYQAGAHDATRRLLDTHDWSRFAASYALRAERLRAELSVDDVEYGETALTLLSVGRRLRRLDPGLATASTVRVIGTAFTAAFATADTTVLARVVDELEDWLAPTFGAGARPWTSDPEAVGVMMLRGWALLVGRGFPAGTDVLRAAMLALRDQAILTESDLQWFEFGEGIARSLWDLETCEMIGNRAVAAARDLGALPAVARLLALLTVAKISTGRFDLASRLFDEHKSICKAIGVQHEPVVFLDAWCLGPADALASIEADERNRATFYSEAARSLVHIAAGRYDLALDCAQRCADMHPLKVYGFNLPVLIEAAVRCGELERARAALDQLVARTQLSGTDWALGLEARSSALLHAADAEAKASYLEAIERLRRASALPDLAWAHLLYGEWLRRLGRRVDARQQLRTAHDLFTEMGATSFGERARRELVASGVTARIRTDHTRSDLTEQERQIAHFAQSGLTNPEIAARLFLSPRTIEYHLGHVFTKLGIKTRRDLRNPAITFD